MASTEIEFQPSKNPKSGIAGVKDGICTFLYNSETGTCCGRTFASWGKITIFYFIYYVLLAGFFAGMMFIFFETISDVEPKQTHYESLLKLNPGMGFRPQLTYESTLIKFNQGDPDTYKEYTENIQVFLDQYDPSLERNNGAVDCSGGKANEDDACIFDMKSLGEECTKVNDFGYYRGTPCVLLKLNKVFGWEPEYYGNDTSLDAEINGKYLREGVFVSCAGTNHRDSDNIGEIDFYPAGGFLKTYFPFKNQKGYQAPVVMARFKTLQPGVLVQVWCKAWSKNIYHHKNDKMGSVQFEILMD